VGDDELRNEQRPAHQRPPVYPADRDAMIERHLGLARHLALRYSDSGEPLDDLFQVASLGLVNAVDRFDPERGVSFTTFAVPTILGELKRHFRDRGWAIHVPRDLKDAALRVRRALAEHTGERAPTAAELAQSTGLPLETVLEALEAAGAQRAHSLDAPTGPDEGAGTLVDLLGHDDIEISRAEQRVLLGDLLTVLQPREREILRLRFSEDLTQSEIGARVGISQMQVSRVIRGALARLRDTAQSGEVAPGEPDPAGSGA
jgi:RNA polymerase sigma-B factor